MYGKKSIGGIYVHACRRMKKKWDKQVIERCVWMHGEKSIAGLYEHAWKKKKKKWERQVIYIYIYTVCVCVCVRERERVFAELAYIHFD